MFLEDLIKDNNDMQTVANEVCYYYGLDSVDIATEGIKEFFIGWKDRIVKWWNEWLKPKLLKLYNMLAKVFPFLKKKNSGAKVTKEVAAKVTQEIPKVQDELTENVNEAQKVLNEVAKVAQKGDNISDSEAQTVLAKAEKVKEKQEETSKKVQKIKEDKSSSGNATIPADKVIAVAETRAKKDKADTDAISAKGATIEQNAVKALEDNGENNPQLTQAVKTASAVVHEATIQKAALSQEMANLFKQFKKADIEVRASDHARYKVIQDTNDLALSIKTEIKVNRDCLPDAVAKKCNIDEEVANAILRDIYFKT